MRRARPRSLYLPNARVVFARTGASGGVSRESHVAKPIPCGAGGSIFGASLRGLQLLELRAGQALYPGCIWEMSKCARPHQGLWGA